MRRVYAVQQVFPRKEAGDRWMLGVDEVQVSVQKVKWYSRTEWWVHCNITRKTHPLSGSRLVATGKSWTISRAWNASIEIVRSTHCQPIERRAKS